MKHLLIIATIFVLGACSEMMDETPADAEAYSVRVLEKVRKEGLYRAKLDTLGNSSIVTLSDILKSDAQKKAFWINLYNAFVQIRLRETPARFENKELFFEEDLFKVGSARLSLKDIEEGLLNRRFAKDFPETLKLLAVDSTDARTYFALNCGAAACPPIDSYNSGDIDDQLNKAMEVFFSVSSTFEPLSNTLSTSEFIEWHKDELGGEQHIIELMKSFGIIPPGAAPDIEYTPYDWSPNTGNYTD